MKLIVGLGNVGGGYDKTYHNVGFMVVDRLARKLNVKFNLEKCKSMIAEAEVNGEKVLIAKPTTYMNLSGKAVVELCKKFKIKKKDLLIVFDDVDLPLAKMRFRENGSGGTHNGMRSVVLEMQSQDISRIRVGVGRDDSMGLADFVLSKIEPHKFEVLSKTFDETVDYILTYLQQESL